jgi:hypothetical protein
LKKRLKELLESGDLDGIADAAEQSRRVLGLLFPFTYNPDPLLSWRAVEATGRAAHRIALRRPKRVRSHLRRMQWLLSEESGGVGWRAPEVMADIVARNPTLFEDYIPIISALLETMAPEDLAGFKPGILWAIGRLGPLALEAVPTLRKSVSAYFSDPDPQVRGFAVWSLTRLGAGEFLERMRELREDEGEVTLYEDGRLVSRTVGELVREAEEGGGPGS